MKKNLSPCNDAGKVIHEGILSRLGADEFMLFGRGGFWVDYQLRHGRYDVTSAQAAAVRLAAPIKAA